RELLLELLASGLMLGLPLAPGLLLLLGVFLIAAKKLDPRVCNSASQLRSLARAPCQHFQVEPGSLLGIHRECLRTLRVAWISPAARAPSALRRRRLDPRRRRGGRAGRPGVQLIEDALQGLDALGKRVAVVGDRALQERDEGRGFGFG